MIGPAGFMANPQRHYDESSDCKNCTHCQTINDDSDNFCTLKSAVVTAVCRDFDPAQK